MINQAGEIVGTNSFGKGRFLGRYPVAYAKVPLFLNWIVSAVANKEQFYGIVAWR
jgi:hypothetical protein